MKKYILALDQGTTSSRAILFDHAGHIVSSKQQTFAQFFPQSGWVEHDPNEIWLTQLSTAKLAMSAVNAQAADITAIGVTNQRETTVVWNTETGIPIYNAIVWQDRRTAEIVDQLKEAGYAELFQQKTGLVLDAYFSGTKIKWILNHVPGAREQAKQKKLAFGTIDTWLIWNLTNRRSFVTDSSNASRTLLFNIHTGQWDEELLDILEVPREILPQVVASSGVIGEASSGLFGKRIPISGIAGDQQAAMFGNLCLKKGMAKNTYGTGCFLLKNTGDLALPSSNHLLTTVAWNLNNQYTYCLEGSVFMGGAVTQWLRDGLHCIKSTEEVESLANSVVDNGGVYLVPAFVGLGAPYWDQYARGALFGITRGTTQAHIARAGLEAIAFQVYDLVQAMNNDAGMIISILRVDGGACKNNFLMQFQADILNMTIERPRCLELTALGAAYLAGLGVGFWQSAEELESVWQLERAFHPKMSIAQREQLLYYWHKAVDRVKNWI